MTASAGSRGSRCSSPVQWAPLVSPRRRTGTGRRPADWARAPAERHARRHTSQPAGRGREPPAHRRGTPASRRRPPPPRQPARHAGSRTAAPTVECSYDLRLVADPPNDTDRLKSQITRGSRRRSQEVVVQSLRVRLLGALQVEGADPARLGRRQVRKLLKVLALYHDRHVGLDRLADCLWGDDPPARPADQISVLVSRLRGVLGVDRVRRNDAGYLLAVDWLDLDALREDAAQADRRRAATAGGAARPAAAAGLALVRGPLLADEPDARWADAERSAADLLVSRLHHTAAA